MAGGPWATINSSELACRKWADKFGASTAQATTAAHGPAAKGNEWLMEASFTLNHTMLRISDPDRSLRFYVDVPGMKLHERFDFPEGKFTL